MRLKYYIRGIGIGIIFATLLLTISFYFGKDTLAKETISDAEIIKRATELGMVMTEEGLEENVGEDIPEESEEEITEDNDNNIDESKAETSTDSVNEMAETLENTNTDNSAESLETNMTIYKCNDTNDKLFLLSYQDAGATYYLTSTKRKAKGSDYAKCQGLFGNSSTGYDNWWLRSPNWKDAKEVYYVMDNGHIDHVDVMLTANGIRPACWIKLRGEKEKDN